MSIEDEVRNWNEKIYEDINSSKMRSVEEEKKIKITFRERLV